MKKLFYVILIILGLMLIWEVFKNTRPQPAAETDIITIVDDGDAAYVEDELIITDADGQIIEDVVSDIVEENPEETSDDHETIIAE